MTISGGSALPKDEIDRMVSRGRGRMPRRTARVVTTPRRATPPSSCSTSTEKFLADNDDKLPEEGKATVTAAVSDLKKALEGTDVDEVKAKHEGAREGLPGARHCALRAVRRRRRGLGRDVRRGRLVEAHVRRGRGRRRDRRRREVMRRGGGRTAPAPARRSRPTHGPVHGAGPPDDDEELGTVSDHRERLGSGHPGPPPARPRDRQGQGRLRRPQRRPGRRRRTAVRPGVRAADRPAGRPARPGRARPRPGGRRRRPAGTSTTRPSTRSAGRSSTPPTSTSSRRSPPSGWPTCLRLQAEFVNYRRRVERDRDVARDRRGRRACWRRCCRCSTTSTSPASTATWTADRSPRSPRSSRRCFGRFGLARYGEPGETFDPAVHEALIHTEAELAAGTTETTVGSGSASPATGPGTGCCARRGSRSPTRADPARSR